MNPGDTMKAAFGEADYATAAQYLAEADALLIGAGAAYGGIRADIKVISDHAGAPRDVIAARSFIRHSADGNWARSWSAKGDLIIYRGSGCTQRVLSI